jgi:hypothetical protein
MVICAGVAILAALLESIIDLTLFRILKDFGVFIATRPTRTTMRIFPRIDTVSSVAQLNVSDLITPETRRRTAAQRGTIDGTLSELGTRGALRGLPAGFAAATMAAMQEATMEFIAKQPKQREELIERAFQVFWRAVR